MKRTLTPLLLVALTSMAFADAPVREGQCFVMIQDETGKVQRLELPGFSVLEQTQSATAFSLPTEFATKPKGVMCVRSSAAPAPNDYKVVAAGIPFYISTDEPDEIRRVVVLGISAGKFRAELLKGQFSKAESVVVQQRLNEFQTAIRESAE